MKLANGGVELELHEWTTGTSADSSAPKLLLLHALGGSAHDWELHAACWPGDAYALDFAGHGRSGWMTGGGYSPEGFAVEADLALGMLEGEICVAGFGIGAYVALLLAGARAARIPGALLLPGRGDEGGGAEPNYSQEREPAIDLRGADTSQLGCDPLTQLCENDLRPINYAMEFAEAAQQLLIASRDGPSPPWLAKVELSARAVPAPADPAEALSELYRSATESS